MRLSVFRRAPSASPLHVRASSSRALWALRSGWCSSSPSPPRPARARPPRAPPSRAPPSLTAVDAVDARKRSRRSFAGSALRAGVDDMWTASYVRDPQNLGAATTGRPSGDNGAPGRELVFTDAEMHRGFVRPLTQWYKQHTARSTTTTGPRRPQAPQCPPPPCARLCSSQMNEYTRSSRLSFHAGHVRVAQHGSLAGHQMRNSCGGEARAISLGQRRRQGVGAPSRPRPSPRRSRQCSARCWAWAAMVGSETAYRRRCTSKCSCTHSPGHQFV